MYCSQFPYMRMRWHHAWLAAAQICLPDFDLMCFSPFSLMQRRSHREQGHPRRPCSDDSLRPMPMLKFAASLNDRSGAVGRRWQRACG
eukprot:scaffold3128_cov121-Isochrysis_galbana.AAC.3